MFCFLIVLFFIIMILILIFGIKLTFTKKSKISKETLKNIKEDSSLNSDEKKLKLMYEDLKLKNDRTLLNNFLGDLQSNGFDIDKITGEHLANDDIYSTLIENKVYDNDEVIKEKINDI